MKFKISNLLTLWMLYMKFAQFWPSSPWEEDVNARHTTNDGRMKTDDDGGQSIAIAPLSEPGDLKIPQKYPQKIKRVKGAPVLDPSLLNIFRIL